MDIKLESPYDFQGLNAIYNYCVSYITETTAENGENLTPGRWTNRLFELSFMLFRGNNLLRNKNNVLDKLKVVSVYIYVYKRLCLEYDKIIKVSDFCTFIGISKSTLYNWNTVNYIYDGIGNINNSNSVIDNADYTGENVTAVAVDLVKLIAEDNEATIVDRMTESNNNPIRYISILNHRYGWNQTDKGTTAQKALTIEEIRASIGLKSIPDGQKKE